MDRRRPQRAEQLVEVPTAVSFCSLQQQSAKQNVDIPVPGTRGDMEVIKVFTQDKIRCSALFEQIVDIPVGGVPQDFLPDSGLAASSAVSREELGQGFFRIHAELSSNGSEVHRGIRRLLVGAPVGCGATALLLVAF